MQFLAPLVLMLTVAAPNAWLLTPDGYGPVRIGMTQKQVSAALKIKLEGEPVEPGDQCVEMVPAGPDRGLVFMFESNRLARISIGAPSTIATPRGIRIGSTAADVKRAYGKGVKDEPHHYEGPVARYLTYWVRPNTRGVRFETNDKLRVQTIHAGGSSIQLVEGCL